MFVRKRALPVDYADKKDKFLDDSPLAKVQAAIEAKRRQNTLAARRSRNLKLEDQHRLEVSLETKE